jgi:hypothetical protein
MRIAYVVGARPNFVKMAPVIDRSQIGQRRRMPDGRHALIHTGQHHDRLMSAIFLEELGVPAPDHMLGVGSASHAVQTARVMERIEPVLEEERPDLVIVPGDVDSTLAATLVAVKLGIPVAHLESWLRSFDRTMPEEVNDIVGGDAMAYRFDKPSWRRSPHPRHPNMPPRCPTPGGARSRACRGIFERGSGSASRRATRPRGGGIPPAEMLHETPRCRCPSRAA